MRPISFDLYNIQQNELRRQAARPHIQNALPTEECWAARVESGSDPKALQSLRNLLDQPRAVQ